MRFASLAILILTAMLPHLARADDEPLAQQFLRSGQLAQGEQALTVALAAKSNDDQARFGLAVVQLVRGVERLGQGLYEYGCRSNSTNAPFLRIPLPENPDPSPITSLAYRRLMDAFRRDLGQVDATLTGIQSNDVKLPLKLAEIRLDLTGDGKPSERVDAILKRLLPPGFNLPDDPEFLVCFDRGDVAWLRAYCHLLIGLIEMQLAVDLETDVPYWALAFPKPKAMLMETDDERERRLAKFPDRIRLTDPVRLRHVREHWVRVCELNRETWAFIQKETDNDHEWLPNPQQTSVLKLPVRSQMVTTWGSMMSEFEALLEGKKAIPANLVAWVFPDTKRNFNLRLWLDEPPDAFDWQRAWRDGIREKYLDDALPKIDPQQFVSAFFAFGDPLFFGYYAVYFN